MPILPNTPIANTVTGTPQADILNGTGAADLIIAGRGADTISAQGAGDVLFGDRGNDTINGEGGPDTIAWVNGDGSDKVNGGAETDTQVVEGSGDPAVAESFRLSAAGADAIFARLSPTAFQLTETNVERIELQSLDGNDTLAVQALTGTPVEQVTFKGGAGNDVLNGQLSTVPIVADGEAGNDTLRGGAQSDQLQGGADNDTLNGGGNNDWLVGGAGDDTILGGTGSDVIEGNAGNDRMTGGAQADSFVVEAVEGEDIILDFVSGTDKIVLRNFSDGGTPLTFNDLTIDKSTGDSVIDLSNFLPQGQATLTVDGVTNLTANDFAFL